jgi:hypothetical protein
MSQSAALVAELATIVPSVRFHPLRIPDGALAGGAIAGTFQRISRVGSSTHSGGTSHKFSRYQLTIYSSAYTAGQDAAEAIAAALNGVRQTWAGGLDVSATLMDEAEDVDPTERGLYRQRIDVMLGSET